MAQPVDKTPCTRVLVATKYRFLGDTLLVVPLLRRITDLLPAADVTLLTGPAAHELLQGCPYVQRTICFNPYSKADEGFQRFLQIVGEVRAGRFDRAFICNRSFHSALIAALAGIPDRVGWSGFQGRDLLLTRTVPYRASAPEIDCYLDLLGPGESSSSVRSAGAGIELWLTEAERSAVAPLLPRAPAGALIGLQPGATHDEKRWPAENFRELMAVLGDIDLSAKFVLIGGPDEAAQANALLTLCAAPLRERCVSLAGKLRLRETLAALSRLDAFIAGDTAIRHAAAALGTPTVALFGPTSAKKWGNADPPARIVLSAETRRVADITVQQALDAVEQARGVGRKLIGEARAVLPDEILSAR